MPKCIIRTCGNKTGLKNKNPDLMMHVFPRSMRRIRLWLQKTGHDFMDMNTIVNIIYDVKTHNNFRLCSSHFTPDCYDMTGSKRYLKDDACPSIFPVEGDKPMIDENVFYRPQRKFRKEREKALLEALKAAEPPTVTTFNKEGILMKDACTEIDPTMLEPELCASCHEKIYIVKVVL
ncbi:THAP domain-containing protein 5-like [Discoglossus pictus]